MIITIVSQSLTKNILKRKIEDALLCATIFGLLKDRKIRIEIYVEFAGCRVINQVMAPPSLTGIDFHFFLLAHGCITLYPWKGDRKDKWPLFVWIWILKLHMKVLGDDVCYPREDRRLIEDEYSRGICALSLSSFFYWIISIALIHIN